MKTVWAILIGLLVLVLGIALGAFLLPFGFRGAFGSGWGMMGPWMMRGGMMGGYGFPLLGFLVNLALLGLLIGGVVWLVGALGRGARAPGAGGPSGETALDVLKRRYAQGEIDKKQFEQMKRDLGE
jgi:putative membrane protein